MSNGLLNHLGPDAGQQGSIVITFDEPPHNRIDQRGPEAMEVQDDNGDASAFLDGGRDDQQAANPERDESRGVHADVFQGRPVGGCMFGLAKGTLKHLRHCC